MEQSVDDFIWDLFKKDFTNQGFEVSEASIKLKFSKQKEAKARGGYTIGQLVHLSDLNDQTAITFDDITGSPYRALSSRSQADLSTILCKKPNKISLPMPIISSNMVCVTGYDMALCMAKMGGLGVLHQFCNENEQANTVKRVKDTKIQPVIIDKKQYTPSLDNNSKYLVAAAVGVKKDNLHRAKKLVDAGVDCLVLDIAHGHSPQMVDAIIELKKEFPNTPLVAGNVVTPKAAYDLCRAGADVLKVGVGPGAACTTRIMTGYGVPQVTAVYETALVAKEFDVCILADGGIKTPGDMVKALAAGADTLMLGSLLAPTKSSNDFENRVDKCDGKYTQVLYFGSASKKSKESQGRAAYDAPEGRSVYLPYAGSSELLLATFMTAMQSGLSYAGISRNTGEVPNIERLRTKSRWKRQSTSGLYEGTKGKK